MRVAVIVQARMGSSRFPGKSMAMLEGRSLLWHALDAAQKIRGKDIVVLATPDTRENDCLSEVAARTGAMPFRGPEHDVLARYYQAALHVGADVVVRVTGDCPLLDADKCDRVIRAYHHSCADYVSNIFPVRLVPSGYDCETFSFGLLADAHFHAKDAYDREHVTPWMQRRVSTNREEKFSVDTPEDLERVRAVIAAPWPREVA